MVTHHRGIVSGWDGHNNRPKGVTTPADMRLSLASIARSEGIMLETGAATTSRYGSSMTFGWSAFTAVIASPLGGWLCPRIEADTLKLTAGHATYDRIDVIWARQWDYQVAGDHPDSEVEVGLATGTPAASPQAPAIPSGALAIWTIRVPKGVTTSSQIPTANIVQAPWTTPVGGILTAATYEEAKALVSRVSASAANPVYVVVDGVLQAWNGKDWGTKTATVTAASTWRIDGTTGRLYRSGNTTTLPLAIRREPDGAFAMNTGVEFTICTIPEGWPVPTEDFQPVGSIHMNEATCPLIFRKAARAIAGMPARSYTLPAGHWCRGLATWTI